MIVTVNAIRLLLTDRTDTYTLDRTYGEAHLLIRFVNSTRQALEPCGVRQAKIGKHGPTCFLCDKYGPMLSLFSRITKSADEPVYD